MCVYLEYNSRGTSTKTRIETCLMSQGNLAGVIQEAHPLKQGLKLDAPAETDNAPVHSRGTSTKTRIETISHRRP